MPNPRRNLRRAGGAWRILVHNHDGTTAHHVQSSPREGLLPTSPDPVDTDHSRYLVLPGTEFDELVIGKWCHLEQMDTTTWWVNLGGVTVWIRANRDGQPTSVTVYGPLDDAGPVEGCAYDCVWTDPPSTDHNQDKQ